MFQNARPRASHASYSRRRREVAIRSGTSPSTIIGMCNSSAVAICCTTGRDIVRKRGERIRVENHCRSSGSIFSNSGLNYALDSAVFAVKMLQAAGQHHPWLLFSVRTIQACDLFRQRLLYKLLERAPPCLAAVAFALRKSDFWNFECFVFTSEIIAAYLRAIGSSEP